MSDLTKHREGCKRLQVGEKEDIISFLPDELLHHILSFLPIKDAVWTCRFSKRWQYLWMSTTNLDFNSYNPKGDYRRKFTRFVDQMLHFHSSNILRFSLSYPIMKTDNTLIESWISAAAQRQVQELNLDFRFPPILSLPPRLCTSAFLTTLRVSSASELHLPSVICLSSLKDLSLARVKFLDDPSFNILFSDLPVLEKLELTSCGWDSIRNVTISLPTLKRFTIEVWHRRKHNCRVKVITENLRYLDCSSDLTVDLVLDNMPLLVDATIEIRTCYTGGDYPADKLFRAVRFAKSLKVDSQSLRYLYGYYFLEKLHIFPVFVNLIALEADSNVICDEASRVLMDIFKSSPILESFVINKLCDEIRGAQMWPQCVEISPRESSMLGFTGIPAAVDFVVFFMKNAKALERIKLYCTDELCSEHQKLEDVMSRLEALRHKSSNNCVIEFIKPYNLKSCIKP